MHRRQAICDERVVAGHDHEKRRMLLWAVIAVTAGIRGWCVLGRSRVADRVIAGAGVGSIAAPRYFGKR